MIRDGIQRWLPTPGLVSSTGADPHSVHKLTPFSETLELEGVSPGPELLYSLCILSSLAVFGVLLCFLLLFFFVPFLFPKAFWLIKHPVQKGENVWFPGFRAVGKQSPSQLRGFRESIGKIGYCTYTKYMYPYMIKHFYHVLGPGCCALLRTEWTFG